jgi:hypothetical protein
MNHYVKNTIFAATLMGAIVGSTDAYASQEKALSVIEATDLIWKMNHKNISTLHAVFFPKKTQQQDEVSMNLEQQRATDKISAIRKAISEKTFGKTESDRVLETFFSASLQEQEDMKTAIKGSYDEYSISTAEAVVAMLLFPVGLFTFAASHMKHVKEIEAQRAGLAVRC